MDRRLKLENLNCLILEFFFSKIYFLDQIYWQALVRPFKWHIGKVCIISRKKVTESGENVKKGLKFLLFHFFDNENGENIFFGPSQLKVPKRWVLMVLKVFQCLLKQKSYKPNKIFLDLLSTNWAFEPLCPEARLPRSHIIHQMLSTMNSLTWNLVLLPVMEHVHVPGEKVVRLHHNLIRSCPLQTWGSC